MFEQLIADENRRNNKLYFRVPSQLVRYFACVKNHCSSENDVPNEGKR